MRNEAVAHAWAHQTSSEGRGSSFWFNGTVLFSFQTAIAEIVIDSEGNDVFLYHAVCHSSYTSRHQQHARSAMPSEPIRILWEPPKRGISDLKHFAETFTIEKVTDIAQDYLGKFQRARQSSSKAHWLGMLNELAENVNQFTALFNLTSVDLQRFQDAMMNEVPGAVSVQDMLDRFEADEQVRLATAAEKRRVKEIEDLAKWRAGGEVHRSFETMALRIKDDEIQTTRRASIPLADAKRFWPLLKKWLAGGLDVIIADRGLRLGSYPVDSLIGDTLTVGCHKIPVSELQMIAKQLNLT